ncbi:hypothetical protein DHD05_15210 [Arenibacter sp. N53]|nr:hypothetical protein [Arenibacter sp. N53]
MKIQAGILYSTIWKIMNARATFLKNYLILLGFWLRPSFIVRNLELVIMKVDTQKIDIFQRKTLIGIDQIN